LFSRLACFGAGLGSCSLCGKEILDLVAALLDRVDLVPFVRDLFAKLRERFRLGYPELPEVLRMTLLL
jgi:hypothetical protein